MRWSYIKSPGCVVVAALLSLMTGVPAAEPEQKGRAIYEELCVRCHGSRGEGVEDECDEPLVGKRSIESLARRIHRTMPDDDPSLCVEQDAEAVARYAYDAFYSPLAQARTQAPRVELARLTNRQYLNTVADLLLHFTGPGEKATDQRGLTGTYYKSRHFRNEAKIDQRVDPQVEFDFGEGSPDPEQVTTNGFSIQWRGSVIADETGEYEFVLKTPNGARLWVNDDVDALIDAGVASGEDHEHQATLRLIGGRSYPVRLDYFRFKEKTASIVMQWKPPHGVREPIPLRNLSPVRPTSTLVVTTTFPPDDSSVGYERGVSVSREWDAATTQAAIEVANHVVKHLDRLSRSKPNDSNRAEKLRQFCEEFVATAFRRPLTDSQQETHVSALLDADDTEEEEVRRVVLLTLKSPRFLYLGLDAANPDDFTVAQRLSFGLWDSLPDRELGKQAAQGRLTTRQQVAGQAERMIRDERARSKLLYFLHHWLQVDHVADLSKDPELYPGFTPEIIAALRTSLNLSLEEAAWGSSPDYRRLLLADTLYLDKRLAAFYGLDAPGAAGFSKVTLDSSDRSGVLTHPYLLAAFSYPKLTSPIHRGVFLTRNIVGRGLKPPPVDVAFKDSEFDPGLTMRQKVEELTRSQACQSCHSVINPLGFSLESYDPVGRLRTRDNGRPVDTVSAYVSDEGETVRLAGPRDVAEFAVGSRLAHEAFIEQLFHQVVKQPMLAYGPEVMTRLHQAFVASDFNMQTLLVDIAVLSALDSTAPRTASH